MITITIDDHGLGNKLSNFDMVTVFKPPMFETVLLLESKMKVYPPKPPGSTYDRKGARGGLGSRWTHEVTSGSNSLTGKVGNNTPYGPFVQDKSFQASIHRGRWHTDVDVLDASIPTITEFFENAASEFLGG